MFPSFHPKFRGNEDFRTFHRDELARDLERSQVSVRAWTAGDGVTPSCVFWSENGDEWRGDGVVLESVSPAANGTSTITCWTFHLSPFGFAEDSSEPVEWTSISLLRDTDVWLKVGRQRTNILRTMYHSAQPCCQTHGLLLLVRLLEAYFDPFQTRRPDERHANNGTDFARNPPDNHNPYSAIGSHEMGGVLRMVAPCVTRKETPTFLPH